MKIILFLYVIGMVAVSICDSKPTLKMSEKEKERYDCFYKLCGMSIKGIKTDDDKKKFDELVRRYEDIITTQENEI